MKFQVFEKPRKCPYCCSRGGERKAWSRIHWTSSRAGSLRPARGHRRKEAKLGDSGGHTQTSVHWTARALNHDSCDWEEHVV